MTSRTLHTLGRTTLDQYVDIVRDTWRNIHGRRTCLDYALHVVDHASKLGEAIRRDNAKLILREIAETTNWLFAFVAKLNDRKNTWEAVLNIDSRLSDIVWAKYPNICPHCFQRLYLLKNGKQRESDIRQLAGKCKYCLADYPAVETRDQKKEEAAKRALKRYATRTRAKKPQSLERTEKMFHRLYESNTGLSTIETIGFHVLEEVGELARGVIDIYTEKSDGKDLKLRRLDLCDEIAEVFSWICSLTLKTRTLVGTVDSFREELTQLRLPGLPRSAPLSAAVGLEKILWLTYRNERTERYHCPYCGEAVCACKVHFSWEERVA